jgi:hypothetical protein
MFKVGDQVLRHAYCGPELLNVIRTTNTKVTTNEGSNFRLDGSAMPSNRTRDRITPMDDDLWAKETLKQSQNYLRHRVEKVYNKLPLEIVEQICNLIKEL